MRNCSLKSKWEDVKTVIESVCYIAWDAGYPHVPIGLRQFENIAMFSCADRRNLLGEFKHQQMLADYRNLKLPAELEFFEKLKVLDLS